jgi:hypothetical protein
MNAASAACIALAACSAPRGIEAREGGEIAWEPVVEIAAGAGRRGPWQQNESDYDHVDDPAIALDPDGSALVAWVDQRTKDVWLGTYAPDGAPRTAPLNVSRTPEVFSWLPRIVRPPARPTDVYLAWQEIVFSGGSHGGELFFARSLDGGATFEAPQNLSRSVPGDGKGRIDRSVWHNGSLDLAAGAGEAIFAVWTEYDGPLWLARSEDRGQTFSAPVQLGGSAEAPARAPSIVAGPGGAVHVAWATGEDPAADIQIRTSTDGGATFGPPRIVERTAGFSDAPKLALDRDGTVHLAFAESDSGPTGRFHIRYARWRAGALGFEAPRELSRPHPVRAESAAFPSLAVDPRGRVLAAWELFPDGRAARGLALTYSLDGGERFAAPVLVKDSRDPGGGTNGSHQGLLLDKLAVTADMFAVANSSLQLGARSRVWLMRGRLGEARAVSGSRTGNP